MHVFDHGVSQVSTEQLREEWARLNDRYFGGMLAAIPIEWSRRLTASAGMFLSRIGPRARIDSVRPLRGPRRLIRLSLPLLRNEPYQEIAGTLAHEMIHQWQYDILKRRPNHGPEFREMMAAMNRDGLRITIRHNLDGTVQALARYAWQCQECGRDYHRQRRTIQPRYHRCGDCHGRLKELPLHRANEPTPFSHDAEGGRPCFTRGLPDAPTQLDLPFA
jgi:predicted SprT family Zn-dependent metalloprotease